MDEKNERVVAEANELYGFEAIKSEHRNVRVLLTSGSRKILCRYADSGLSPSQLIENALRIAEVDRVTNCVSLKELYGAIAILTTTLKEYNTNNVVSSTHCLSNSGTVLHLRNSMDIIRR